MRAALPRVGDPRVRPGCRPESACHRRRALALDAALGPLADVRLGRIVFTRNALPAIGPIDRIVEGGEGIIRTQGDSALAGQTSGTGTGGVRVACEAGRLDPCTRKGWSVVVAGYARKAKDPNQIVRHQACSNPGSMSARTALYGSDPTSSTACAFGENARLRGVRRDCRR